MFINLTQGLKTQIDDLDFAIVNNHKWHAWKSKTNIYYAAAKINNKNVRLHRYLLKPKKGQVVDHKNRDTLDNRRVNLRICDYSINGRNSRTRPNKTGYRGVTKMGNKWRAQIKINYQTIHLGLFDSALEAANAYSKKNNLILGG